MDNKGCCAMPASCDATGPKKEGPCTPKKGCCGFVLKGAFIGGIVMFLYFSASWMLVPWHAATMSGFKDEAAVAKVLSDNAPESGVYVLPHMTDLKQAPAVEKPAAFVALDVNGFDAKNMNKQMAQDFLLCFFLSALLTCMLKKQAGCGCPVGYSVKVGVLVALAANVPNLIWWHFPVNYTLVSMADDVLAFALAGLVISKCLLKKGGCGPEKTACGDKPASCG